MGESRRFVFWFPLGVPGGHQRTGPDHILEDAARYRRAQCHRLRFLRRRRWRRSRAPRTRRWRRRSTSCSSSAVNRSRRSRAKAAAFAAAKAADAFASSPFRSAAACNSQVAVLFVLLVAYVVIAFSFAGETCVGGSSIIILARPCISAEAEVVPDHRSDVPDAKAE